MLMGKALTDLILLEWSPVKCDWAWLRHQNKNNDEKDEKYHGWMEMEKQFKVVIEDEDVWVSEV